nr:putative nuclease HARBI1 [Neodiprion pinetum]
MANMQDMFNFYDQIEEMNNMIEVVAMVNVGPNDEDEGEVQRAPKRYIRDGQNPFEFYSEQEFKRRFRFSKDGIMYGILPRIEAALVSANNCGLPIPPVMQLLICLRFYATASFQLVNGDLMTISQSTVSRIIHRVSAQIASLIHAIIKIPSTEAAMIANRDLFRQLGARREGIGLPGVDGAIDCTHIRLCHTKFADLQEVYRNRKGYFSLNVQAVVGPNMEFLDVVLEWPGSNHDSRIFQNSRIYMRYHERQLTGTLVGDAGYPCLPFLLTPLANPITDAQQRYNNVQSRTRQIVERTFGVWKRRFPCLSRGLGTKLLCSTTIVVACAVLHNLSLTLDNALPEDNRIEEEEADELPPQAPHWQPGEGFAIREALIERLFI